MLQDPQFFNPISKENKILVSTMAYYHKQFIPTYPIKNSVVALNYVIK